MIKRSAVPILVLLAFAAAPLFAATNCNFNSLDLNPHYDCDICTGTYNFYVYRPGWAGKHMRLSVSPWFQDYDSNSKVGLVAVSVNNH